MQRGGIFKGGRKRYADAMNRGDSVSRAVWSSFNFFKDAEASQVQHASVLQTTQPQNATQISVQIPVQNLPQKNSLHKKILKKIRDYIREKLFTEPGHAVGISLISIGLLLQDIEPISWVKEGHFWYNYISGVPIGIGIAYLFAQIAINHGCREDTFSLFPLLRKKKQRIFIENARWGSIKNCKMMIEKGMYIDSRYNSATALMEAAENGEIETVKYLLSVGANPLLKNKKGKTAYELAENAQVKQILAGAERVWAFVNKKIIKELNTAVQNCSPDNVRAIIENL